MARVRSVVEIGIALAAAEVFALYAGHGAERVYALANALATVSGVLFGFLLTAIAMLASLPERRLIENMRRTGHYRALMGGTFAACGVHFSALVASLLALFSQGLASVCLLTMAIALETFAILRTAQSGNRFRILFNSLEGAR